MQQVNKLQTALQTQRPSELLHNAVYQAQRRKPIVDSQGRYVLPELLHQTHLLQLNLLCKALGTASEPDASALL